MSVITPMRASPHHIVTTVVVACVTAVLGLPAPASAWGPPRSGGLGHQTMRGGAGPDYLRGDEGPDTLLGRGGGDLLTGDTGPDAISGGAGGDTISGGSGNDVLDGGPGNDVISGGFGKDGIDGGPGADALDGGNDADTIVGGPGNDVLHGGSGVDRLDGGDGDDRIFADSGGDEIRGGDGDDTIVVDGSAYAHVTCGAGRDTLYLVVSADATSDYAGRGLVADYARDCEIVRVTDVLDDPNKGQTYLAPDGGGERTGGARDDTLLGGPGPDTLHGGAGNDVLWGLRQPDVASVARDVLDAGPGDDTVYGGPGPQVIVGGPGDDFLESGIGDGSISGGAGNDTIRLRGAGLTRVDAGSGNDTIYARGVARGRIACGRGRDIVYADAGDSVARDCERRVGASAPERTARAASYADAVATTPGLVHRWRLGEHPQPGVASSFEIHDDIGGASGSIYGLLGQPGVTDDGDTAWASPTPSFPDFISYGWLSLALPDTILHGSFTFEAWFRADDLGTDRGLLQDTIPGHADGVVFVRGADGALRAAIGSSTDARRVELATAPLNLTPASWHHIALTRADDRIAIYVDGAVAAEGPATPVDIEASTYGIGVGQRFGRVKDWFGAIDEVALYDRALDAATIAAHAHADDDGTPPVARVDPPLAAIVPKATVVNLTTGHAGAGYRCALDGSDYAPCNPIVPLYSVPDGNHVLRVLATSRTGVVQTAPTIVAFTIDATLPATLLAVRISPDGDGRAIASFGSNQRAHFECRRGNLFPFSPDGWAPCSAPLDVARDQEFEVRAVDEAGNRDPTPANVFVPAAGRTFSGTPALPAFAGARAEAKISGEPVGATDRLRFQCRVDTRDWAACARTLTLPILDAGRHVLQVRQAVLGDLATAPPMTWNVGPAAGSTQIAGMQASLILERGSGLVRRAPTVRFALSAPAAVQVSVLRRGHTAIRVAAAGRSGSNVVAIPGAKLRALGTGRFTLRVAARAAGARASAVQELALAIVPSLR